jgi:hypothetical protein
VPLLPRLPLVLIATAHPVPLVLLSPPSCLCVLPPGTLRRSPPSPSWARLVMMCHIKISSLNN